VRHALEANGESDARAVIVELLIRLIAADVACTIRDIGRAAAVRINRRGAISAVPTVPADVNVRRISVMMDPVMGAMSLSGARK